ncbi:MAG TPA: hypothetical protein VKB12_06450 [Pyrinomonadaceae bacterium]|nr:hypothetical protein [Pyrinomonadaceae bacterium]
MGETPKKGDAEFDGEFYAVYILEDFQRAGLGHAPARKAWRMKDEVTTDKPHAREEPPPFGGSWKNLYAAVLINLAVLVALFYLFTRAFR